MASEELSRLWKLAQIDNALVEVRTRAANLDVGKKIQEEIESLSAVATEATAAAHALSGELRDLELAQKSAQDKIDKFDKQLFSGKVVNPREVENIQKEISLLKKHRDEGDERILELYDSVPPAKEHAAKAQAALEEKKQALVNRRKEALKEKQTLETNFAELNKRRSAGTGGISPTLLARYEAIRQSHNGIGMVQALKTENCGGCGMHLPERTMQALKDEKTVACEACQRILYWTEGLV